MLKNLKKTLRLKGRRVPLPVAETSDTHGQVLCDSSSNESLVRKVATASKQLYVVCKHSIASLRTSSAKDATQSHSSLDLHCDSTHSNPADRSVNVGVEMVVPDSATITGEVSADDASPTPPDASVQTKPVIAATQATTDNSKSNSKVKSESDLDGSYVYVVVGPDQTPLGLCEHQEAECQEITASVSSCESIALPNMNSGSHDSKGTGSGDDEDEEEEHGENNEGNGEESDDDTDDEQDDVGYGPSHPRSEWKTIRAISNDQIELIAKQHLPSYGNFRVTSRTSGTYNLVAFLSDTEAAQSEPEYVLRIPSHGTPSHWTQEDAYMLEREIQLMEHIRRNTKVPVAEVLTYCSDCNNELGSPFTLMTKLPGKSAYEIWFDLPYSPSDAFRNADVPSVATEKKRVNFLRSLARTMTELQVLSFDQIGMPEISEDGQTVTIGPSYVWGEYEDDVDKAKEICTFMSTHRYIQLALVRRFKLDPRAAMNDSFFRALGARKILDIIFSQSVFSEDSSEPETFTIHHNDLDLQNILVDDEGNVTGIIDWDKSFAAPRCIGASALPVFLCSDWFPRYTHNIMVAPHMGWNEHYYRQIYAAAMVEAGNADAKYTMKSAMYQASTSALYEGGYYKDLTEKLVRYVPECRIGIDDLALGLGKHWPAAAQMLKREFKKIFEPQLPCEGLLEKLDTELILNGWWCEVDELLDFYEEEAEAEAKALHDESSDDEDNE